MKKSKFLLLGTLSSLAAIPFVAAKCGDTKEEENKKPAEMPGGGQTDSTPSTSTAVNLSKLEQTIQDQLNKLAKDGVKKEEVLAVLKTVEGLKDIKDEDLATVEFKNKKLVIVAKEGSKLVSGKYEFTVQSEPETSMESNKIDLDRLEESVKQELNKLAKNYVLSEDVLDVLKKVQGLESLRLGDIKTVEFKDNKLVIEANKDSKLVSGKYEFVAQTDSDTTTTKQKLSDALKTIANSNLGKVQVSKEDKDKKEKVEEAIKTALVAKVTTLKGKDLKLKADLSKNSVVVSSNDFEGEVTLKFEVETSPVAKAKLSDALKTIANSNLGKVQVSKEDKDKKEKVEEAIKTALVAKVTTLKGKDLKLKADLSKNSVVVSSNDFEGEVTLKFEIEAKSE
ncbi:variable surface lipoprotein [Mycoplasmopsis agalactiae]|uniref:variable surface lipoprotein n=1 Tax=Mycoplasmopsis agalactiae TaxID=2110 RepID=UPI00211CBC78|nr:variable surface lipoprotein [Mycoplasmopsis agalactiae]UUM25492.1 variable surface lipoprotein [Mycoplasmopsis agalactiae]